MIKIVKVSALVSTILLASGMIFKSQHLLGANVIFTTGAIAGVICAILMISFLFGKSTSGLERISLIVTSITIVLVLLGSLFKVMHWPGAAMLIWIADLGIVFSGILFLVDGYLEKDPTRSIMKIITMFFILFLLMLIVLTN